jgi:vancomycin resistance protein VanJ
MLPAYGAFLVALLFVRFLGDRSPLLFAVNALSLYGFVPLPLVIIAAVALRRVSAMALSALGVGAWLSFWGGLFLPRMNTPPPAEPLVVLTFNALGFNPDPAHTMRVIRDSAADLVALQELNPETATRIERELPAIYPYRWLEPQSGARGGGILSKHPFTRSQPALFRHGWPATPMVAFVDVSGTRVTVVRFHAASGSEHFYRREQQARALAAYAQAHEGPLIITGDLNATDQNRAYTLLAEQLDDSWREAGWGFGHTFPGPPTKKHGGSRPTIAGVPAPLWLLRIDYVFHSRELRTSAARLARPSEGSDHRGVIATLVLDQRSLRH